MGEIIKTENLSSNKTIIQMKLTQEEAQKIGGHSKKVHLFSGDLCLHEAKIFERGAKKGAKYVSIPLILRERKHPRLSEIQYQKVETDKKIFYIATTKKEKASE